MAKINVLTARAVATAGPGFHSDGGNLYLRVRPTGQRSWVFRFQLGGRTKKAQADGTATDDGKADVALPGSGGKPYEVALGGVRQRSLKEARQIATTMRTTLDRAKSGPEADPAPIVATLRAVAVGIDPAIALEAKAGSNPASVLARRDSKATVLPQPPGSGALCRRVAGGDGRLDFLIVDFDPRQVS